MHVAEIEDEALLGVDILQNGKGGPADILLSKGTILLDNHEIPCIQVGVQEKVRKVTVAQDCVVPGCSEAVVDVFVSREEQDDISGQTDYLIEPSDNFKENFQLQMGASLVDINWEPTCKVRILNPLPSSIKLYQDTVIGQAEAVQETEVTLKQCEYDGDSTACNNASVRRLCIGSKTERLRRTTTTSIKGEAVLPEHMTGLFNKSASNLSPQEKNTTAKSFGRVRRCFLKE